MNRPRISVLTATALLLLSACKDGAPLEKNNPDASSSWQQPQWPLESSYKACTGAGGIWAYGGPSSVAFEYCHCPDRGSVFSYDQDSRRGECAQLTDKAVRESTLDPVDGQAKWGPLWVFSVPGKGGTLRVPESREVPGHTPNFIVPGVKSSLEWQSIPENSLFFTYGLTSTQRDSGVTVVGYDLPSAAPGASGRMHIPKKPYPITGSPKGLSGKQSNVYRWLTFTIEQYYDRYLSHSIPFSEFYDQSEGDCLISCRLSINAADDFRRMRQEPSYEWIDNQIVIELEMVGGVRAHKRLAFYSKSDPTRLLGIVTLNLNFTVGLIGIGPEEGVRPMEDPGLSTFKFFDAEGNQVPRRRSAE